MIWRMSQYPIPEDSCFSTCSFWIMIKGTPQDQNSLLVKHPQYQADLWGSSVLRRELFASPYDTETEDFTVVT